MPVANELHPSPAELLGFAQGRLPPAQVARIEQHVATCDTCCQHLQAAPDDTLVHLAREAATCGFRDEPAQPASRKAPPPDIPPELQNHPRYRVLGLVGLGGMGAVYKAEHRLMGRLVALKVISPAFLKNAAAVARFRGEFRATAMLSHPHVVTAFDADQAGDLHFLVMEFVEGLPLDRLVAQRGRLSVPLACRLIRQAAEGLQHIHEKKLVHRDIKPQNLMVGRQSHVKILDCGLTRSVLDRDVNLIAATGDAAANPHATTAGMILGTPDYIAPEQCADARSADIRSDIYSLGCTLYFALTGQPPFPHGTVVEKLNAHSSASPPAIESLRDDVPPELSRILSRMMAKDPAQRYQTPGELARDLAPLESEPAPKENLPQLAVIPAAAPAVHVATLPVPESADRLFNLSLDTIGNLPRVERGGQGRGFKFGTPQLVAVLLACGTALALMILAYPLASYLWNLPNRAVADNQPLGSQQGSRPKAAPGIAQSLPRKVLLVIPHHGLWYRDFQFVKESLVAEKIDLVVASSELSASSNWRGSANGVAFPDIDLDAPLDAGQFGAIIFVGYDTSEYHPGPGLGDRVGRIIDDFRDRGRLVTAICTGQRVLAAHGELRDKQVAYANYTEQAGAYKNCGAKLVQSRVERDGQIITAAADIDAKAFVAEIVAALNGQ